MPLICQAAHIVQGLLADRQDLPLERVLILHLRTGDHDRLADHRHRFDYALAEAVGVGRHFAPAEQRLALGRDVVFEQADREVARVGVLRQEAHRHRVATERRQCQVVLLRPVAQQLVRHLDQAAGAVAHQRVGTDRAAMIQIDQDLQPASDDIVRLSALDVDDEAHAARVMLVAGIVQSWSRRGSHHWPSIASVCRTWLRRPLPGRVANVDVSLRFAALQRPSWRDRLRTVLGAKWPGFRATLLPDQPGMDIALWFGPCLAATGPLATLRCFGTTPFRCRARLWRRRLAAKTDLLRQ